MQTVDTSSLKALGRDGLGPWQLEDGRLLRVAMGGKLLATPEEAQAQLEAYNAARAAGARTPEAFEAVRIVNCLQKDKSPTEGYGVVVEFVPGLPLSLHILLGSYGIEEAATEIGRLQREFHGLHMSAGHDWNAEFVLRARCMAMLLPQELGARLVELIEAIPPADALLHGDLHVGNIVVSRGTLSLIDMECAGFGNPVLDLGISYARVFQNAPFEAERIGLPPEKVPELSRRMWEAQLRSYLGEVDKDAFEEVNRRFQVIAEVERCGLTCNIATITKREPTDFQRRGIATSAEALEQLLPQLTRLDLGDII